MANEIEVKRDPIVGLSFKENKEFWIKEDKFNYYFNLLSKIYLTIAIIIFQIPLLQAEYEIDIYIYIPLMIFHYIHNFYYVYTYFQGVNTVNLFSLTMFKFFLLKLNCLYKKFKMLNYHDSKVDNHKLNRLMLDFNFIILEMQYIDSIFRLIIGTCFWHFFLTSFIVFFLCLSVDFILAMILFVLLMSTFFLMLFLPSIFNNSLISAMDKISKILQNIAFKSETDFANKKKINYISFSLKNHQAGFTCLNLFVLTSYRCFIVRR